MGSRLKKCLMSTSNNIRKLVVSLVNKMKNLSNYGYLQSIAKLSRYGYVYISKKHNHISYIFFPLHIKICIHTYLYHAYIYVQDLFQKNPYIIQLIQLTR